MKTIHELKKDFITVMNQLSYSRHKWQVWQDFNELAALSIAQSTGFTDDREASYMRVVERYTPEEMQLFPQLIGITTAALELQMCDFLGEMFMELELGNKWKGQFFTPYHLCLLMSELTFDAEPFRDGAVVTFNEPACGGGAMVIAYCETYLKNGINFQQQLKVTCQDVDFTAYNMAYIQLSLLGCNATVVHANTLTMEEFGHVETPIARLFPLRAASDRGDGRKRK